MIGAVTRRVTIVMGFEERLRAGIGIRPGGEQRGSGFYVTEHACHVQWRARREQPVARTRQ